MVEHQVTGPQLVQRDVRELRPLVLADPGDRVPGGQPGLRSEAGAVVVDRPGATPQVVVAELRHRERDGLAPGRRGRALALAECAGGEEGQLGLVGLLLLQLLQLAALRAGERADHLLDGRQLGGDVPLDLLLLGGQRLGLDEGGVGLLLKHRQRGTVGLELVQEGRLRAAGGGPQLGYVDGLVRVLGEQQVGVLGGVAVAVLRPGQLGGEVHAVTDGDLLAGQPGVQVGGRGLLLGELGGGRVVLLGRGLGVLVELVQAVQHRPEGGLGVGQRVRAGGDRHGGLRRGRGGVRGTGQRE